MKEYSLDKLKEHINKVHISTKQDISIFTKNIDFDSLILQLPSLLEKARLVNNHYFEQYEIEYKNIGSVNEKESNTLRIIVLSGTKKVITMYPVEDRNCLMNYNNKRERKSQIDKFNKKYKK